MNLFKSCLLLFCSCVFQSCSISITSLGEERANPSAFRTFVRFALVCLFSLPLGVWEGLRHSLDFSLTHFGRKILGSCIDSLSN